MSMQPFEHRPDPDDSLHPDVEKVLSDLCAHLDAAQLRTPNGETPAHAVLRRQYESLTAQNQTALESFSPRGETPELPLRLEVAVSETDEPKNLEEAWPYLVAKHKSVMYEALCSDGGNDAEAVEWLCYEDGSREMVNRVTLAGGTKKPVYVYVRLVPQEYTEGRVDVPVDMRLLSDAAAGARMREMREAQKRRNVIDTLTRRLGLDSTQQEVLATFSPDDLANLGRTALDIQELSEATTGEFVSPAEQKNMAKIRRRLIRKLAQPARRGESTRRKNERLEQEYQWAVQAVQAKLPPDMRADFLRQEGELCAAELQQVRERKHPKGLLRNSFLSGGHAIYEMPYTTGADPAAFAVMLNRVAQNASAGTPVSRPEASTFSNDASAGDPILLRLAQLRVPDAEEMPDA